MALTMDEASVSLSAIQRFYSSILVKMHKVETRELDTMGVGFTEKGKLCIYYNPDFTAKLDLKAFHAVLIHECMHVLYKHMTRLDKKIYGDMGNIAADMAINQMIDRKWFQAMCDMNMPPIYPDSFQITELNQYAELYYLMLKEKQKEQQEQQGQSSEEGESNEGENKSKGKSTSKKSKQDKQDKGQGAAVVIDNHDVWNKSLSPKTGKFVEVNAEEVDMESEVSNLVNKAIAEAKERGYLPTEIAKQLDHILEKSKLNWKRQLRVFVNSMLSVHKKLSTKRVNRRSRHLGLLLPGKKKGKKPSILVARDTSGSVFCDEVQNEFLNEIIALTSFADIILVDADTEIHSEYKVTKLSDVKTYKGGGGTSFVEVFKRAKELNVNGVIYLTDLEGEFPSLDVAQKYQAKTIWVTAKGLGDTHEIPFGKKLVIEK